MELGQTDTAETDMKGNKKKVITEKKITNWFHQRQEMSVISHPWKLKEQRV